jgi:hypothetical protein
MAIKDDLGNVCNHRVRLHFCSIGMPAVPEYTALANAQRVFGRYAICIQIVSGRSEMLPEDDALTLDTIDGQCKWNEFSDEQTMLYDLRPSDMLATDVAVFYVSKIKKTDGSELAGCAGHEPSKPSVMVSSVGSKWTLAHELCHVLLGPTFTPVHATSTANLMYAPSASITADPPGLTTDQLSAVRRSPYCVAC